MLQTIDIPPNQTVYVNNLNEKIKKEELRRSLYHLFSQFGNILEVMADRTPKRRGQAWLVYDDLSGATRAVKGMQGFVFYGKPLTIRYAKSRSDVIAKMEGTYKPREKKKEDVAKKASDATRKSKKQPKPPPAPPVQPPPPPPPQKPAPGDKKAVENKEDDIPNRILFVENFPPETTPVALTLLFKQYLGFKDCRMIDGKPGIAFVEFNDQYQGGKAKDALQNFKITEQHKMKISYAKQ